MSERPMASMRPEDVRNKRFTPVRFRQGYDMDEVDRFLDRVEAELGRLGAENTRSCPSCRPDSRPGETQTCEDPDLRRH